jgi:hypothetical protein
MNRAFACGVLAILALGTGAAVLAQGPPGGGGPLIAPKGGKAKGKAAPAPHLPDGTPDLAGVWTGWGSNSGDISKGLKAGSEVVMLDWAEEVFKKRLAKDDPQGN